MECMEIRRFLRILLSRKWVVILTTEAALLIAALVSFRMTPIYTATATVRVAQTAGVVSFQDLNYADRIMQTYVHLLTSHPFLEAAAGRLHLNMSADQLGGMVKVDAVPTTELITINASSKDPQQAAAIANVLGALLVEQGQKLYSGQGQSASAVLQQQLTAAQAQLERDRALLAASSATPAPGTPASAAQADLSARIDAEQRTYATLLDQYDKARIDEALTANSVSLVDPASPPSAPSKPRIPLNTALGTLLGLLGGIGLALVLESMNPTIHSAGDLQAITDAPVMGRVPAYASRGLQKDKLILERKGAAYSAPAEAFRRLSGSLTSLASRKGYRQLLITSVEPRAGKSTVVANLGVAMAQAGKRVILVDADLRNPSLHTLLGMKNGSGLSELVRSPALLSRALVDTKIPGLRLLRAGSVDPNPGQILSAPTLPEIMRKLAGAADFVLWDSPPAGMAADASLLAPLADGVLLVAAQDQTSTQGIDRAVDDLDQAGAQFLGLIYNRASEDGGSYYHRPVESFRSNGHLEPHTRTRPRRPVPSWHGSPTGSGQGNGAPVDAGDQDLAL